MSDCTRRVFMAAGPVGVLSASALGSTRGFATGVDKDTVGPEYPTTPAERAQAIVGASHVRIDRVKELLGEDPGLAKASWDWGFGDWETAIGAASHTGQIPIIELLIAHGARPTLFTMATLDQIDAVRAVLEHVPGADALEGPHSISLYDHARAGQAARVLEYLGSKGLKPEDPFPTDRAAVEMYLSEYTWGVGANERFAVEWSDRMSAMTIKRLGGVARGLTPAGDHVFLPAGAHHVRIRFQIEGGRAARVTVTGAGPEVIAERV